MSRPGLLLYFDILPALDGLPAATVGELLLAALHYAQDGVEPDFEDNALTFAWAFIKPTVDRDGATYETKRLRGEWMAYCKQCKRDGVKSLDFDTWRERADNVVQHTGNVTLPTTSSATSPSTSSSNGNREDTDVSSCVEPIITLPLNDGSEYPVSQEQCQEWVGLYPAVDVIQQLRGMRGWLLSNKARRKTKRGIDRFITNWLSREQDRGRSGHSSGERGEAHGTVSGAGANPGQTTKKWDVPVVEL